MPVPRKPVPRKPMPQKSAPRLWLALTALLLGGSVVRADDFKNHAGAWLL